MKSHTRPTTHQETRIKRDKSSALKASLSKGPANIERLPPPNDHTRGIRKPKPTSTSQQTERPIELPLATAWLFTKFAQQTASMHPRQKGDKTKRLLKRQRQIHQTNGCWLPAKALVVENECSPFLYGPGKAIGVCC